VSNVHAPNEIKYTIKNKSFGFLWNNKRGKTERESIHRDYDKGGIPMTDVDIMIKVKKIMIEDLPGSQDF